MSRFEMTFVHPYESAEALCRRRNKVPTTAKWQVVWADSRWYGPAMMSTGRGTAFLKASLCVLMNLLKLCDVACVYESS